MWICVLPPPEAKYFFLSPCGLLLLPHPLFMGLGTQVSYTILKVFLPTGERNQDWKLEVGWAGTPIAGLSWGKGPAHTWRPVLDP